MKRTVWFALACGIFVGLLGAAVVRAQMRLNVMDQRATLRDSLQPVIGQLEARLARDFAAIRSAAEQAQVQSGRQADVARGILSNLGDTWWSDGTQLVQFGRPSEIAEKAWTARLRTNSTGSIETHASEIGQEYLMLIQPMEDTPSGASSWFGMALDINELFAKVGLAPVIEGGFGINIVSLARPQAPLYWSSPAPLQDPLAMPIQAPGEHWTLLAAPNGGWIDASALWSGGIFAFLLGLTYCAGFVFLARRPLEMGDEIALLDERLATKDARLLALTSTQSQLELQLKRSVNLDGETGLAKRTSFLDLLTDLLSKARKNADGEIQLFVVRFLQLDHLRHSLGENAARSLLASAIARLEELALDGVQLGRLNSREIALCLQQSDTDAASELCQRIVSVLQSRYAVESQALSLKAVVGCAVSLDGYDHAPELLDRAALAADSAESDGRAWAEFEARQKKERISMLQLEADLLVAIPQEELRIYYQPVVSVKEGNVSGFEALLRWQHPKLGMIPPDRFLPLAESAGLLKSITEWLFRNGVEQVRDWRDRHDRPFYVNFNLSPDDLSKDMCRFILDTIQTANLPTQYIGVEVTETGIVSDFLAASDLIRWLKDQGIRVLLDDFGTGYSSLSYLRELPFSAVKIDKSFIQHMTSNPKDFGLVTSIVNLSRYMEMECVAEGVETQEQLDLVEMTDCDYWQGYLCSKPVAANEAERLLTSGMQAAVTASR